MKELCIEVGVRGMFNINSFGYKCHIQSGVTPKKYTSRKIIMYMDIENVYQYIMVRNPKVETSLPRFLT